MALGPKSAPKVSHGWATKIRITKLGRLEEKCFGPRHKKTDFYEYLDEVLKLYLEWKDARVARIQRDYLAEWYPKKVKIRRNTHTIRSIIDASSKMIDALSAEDKKEEEKKRSRWTSALEFAVLNRGKVKVTGLGGFFGRNGGPAGCAKHMAAIRKAKKGAPNPVSASKKGTKKSSRP